MYRQEPSECPRCQRLMQAAMGRTNIWQGDCLIVVEDIPAQMCEQCGEQFYDDLVAEALRSFVEKREDVDPKRVIEVPVYSLEGHVRVPPPPAEEEEIPEIPELPEA